MPIRTASFMRTSHWVTGRISPVKPISPNTALSDKQYLPKEGGFSDTRFPSYEHNASLHQTAAQHPVHLLACCANAIAVQLTWNAGQADGVFVSPGSDAIGPTAMDLGLLNLFHHSNLKPHLWICLVRHCITCME